MKTLTAILCLLVILFACRPAKKVQKIQTAISKVDTTSTVIVQENHQSADSAKEVFNRLFKNKIEYTTFNAKVKVQYEGKEGGDEATAIIRLQKDSVIWLSLRGALGIEGFRALITKDSVKVMNLLKKNVQFRSIGYLQEITSLPFDFKTLQDLIVGNPVFVDSNVVSYKLNANNELLILMSGVFFKHLVSLDNADNKILHSKLDDVDAARNRTCDITFSDYEKAGEIMFSKKRKISVAEQSKLDINLDFKQYYFNQPQTFPFNISKNYKRL